MARVEGRRLGRRGWVRAGGRRGGGGAHHERGRRSSCGVRQTCSGVGGVGIVGKDCQHATGVDGAHHAAWFHSVWASAWARERGAAARPWCVGQSMPCATRRAPIRAGALERGALRWLLSPGRGAPRRVGQCACGHEKGEQQQHTACPSARCATRHALACEGVEQEEGGRCWSIGGRRRAASLGMHARSTAHCNGRARGRHGRQVMGGGRHARSLGTAPRLRAAQQMGRVGAVGRCGWGKARGEPEHRTMATCGVMEGRVGGATEGLMGGTGVGCGWGKARREPGTTNRRKPEHSATGRVHRNGGARGWGLRCGVESGTSRAWALHHHYLHHNRWGAGVRRAVEGGAPGAFAAAPRLREV